MAYINLYRVTRSKINNAYFIIFRPEFYPYPISMCRTSPKLCGSLTGLVDIRGLSIVDTLSMPMTGSRPNEDSLKLFWKKDFKCRMIMSIGWNPIHFCSSSCVMVIFFGLADLALSCGRIGGSWVNCTDEGGTCISFCITWWGG